jgi:hypothetical protein
MTETEEHLALPYELERRQMRLEFTASAPHLYDAAVALNLLAIKRRDQWHSDHRIEPIALGILARGIDLLEPAILLCEVGSATAALALVRGGLECTFALAALSRGCDLSGILDKAHASERASWARAQQRVSADVRFDQGTLDQILEVSAGVKPFKTNFAQIAEAGGLSDFYDCIYKPLSHFSVHMSAGSLTGALTDSQNGEVCQALNLIVRVYARLVIASLDLAIDEAIFDKCRQILESVNHSDGAA